MTDDQLDQTEGVVALIAFCVLILYSMVVAFLL
jgi:hypothetical protein